ncbi:hypothetical protein B0H13DRAFT_2310848 [Mycena leptocephala]|nr:hypothetical protein B0H13DRAFT_2310848 [Mycena leptocephala]
MANKRPQAKEVRQPKHSQGGTQKSPQSRCAVVDDDFQGETIEVLDPRATTWAFFDNDACHDRLYLRDVLPSFQSYYHKKPTLHLEHIAFLYSASRAAQFAIEAHPQHVSEQEFSEIVNVYSPHVKDLRRKQGIAAALPGFIIPRIAEPPGGSGFAASDDEMDEVLSVHDAENESFVGGQNDDDEEDEVPAPKRPRREVAALHHFLSFCRVV